MSQQTTYNHLNDFIQMIIQSSGFEFVVENYIDLREQYYYQQ